MMEGIVLYLAVLAVAFGVLISLLNKEGPKLSIFQRFRLLVIDETGALTLAEAAKYATDQLRRGIIETFVLESPVLSMLNFIELNGNAYKYNEETTLPGVEFRAVNAAYTESTGVITPKTETIVILGGEADVDRFLVQTRGGPNAIADLRSEQEFMKVKSLTHKWQDTFINGDTAVDANSFDGLKKRLTGTQLLTTGANGINVVGADDATRQTFFDQLDLLLAQVDGGADALFMNVAIRQKIQSSARRLGWPLTEEDVAEGQRIIRYSGIPMIDIGKKADGTNIIPITETQGTSTDSSSIYAVKLAAGEDVSGVLGLTNGFVMVDDLGFLEAKPVFRTRVELYSGIAVFGKGAARLQGVRNG